MYVFIYIHYISIISGGLISKVMQDWGSSSFLLVIFEKIIAAPARPPADCFKVTIPAPVQRLALVAGRYLRNKSARHCRTFW